MKRLFAIMKKEFRHIRRDPLSLGLLLVVPALLLVLYGYALSFDVKHIPVACLDRDGTAASRLLQDSLFQNPYFDRAQSLEREEEADALLTRGRVRAVLIIPRDYQQQLRRGETARIQVLMDGADANSASTAIGYLEAMADRMTRQIQAQTATTGSRLPRQPAVMLEPRIWFNPELISAKFLVPGLIGMLLMLAAVVATSLSIVREKERETMEQLQVSPVRPLELILGKTLPYVVICLTTMLMILGLSYYLFGVVVQGSYLLLGATTLVFLFAALSMGVLISTVTRSQQVAFQVAVITSLLPSIILSGLIFPIAQMPRPIQCISYVVVPRYFVAALRGIILKGAPWEVIRPELAAMLGLGLFFMLMAARNFRKSI